MTYLRYVPVVALLIANTGTLLFQDRSGQTQTISGSRESCGQCVDRQRRICKYKEGSCVSYV